MFPSKDWLTLQDELVIYSTDVSSTTNGVTASRESPTLLHQPRSYGQILQLTRPRPNPPDGILVDDPLEIPSKVDCLLGTRLQTAICGTDKWHAICPARAQTAGDTSAGGVLVKFAARCDGATHHPNPVLLHTRHRQRVSGHAYMSESEGG